MNLPGKTQQKHLSARATVQILHEERKHFPNHTNGVAEKFDGQPGAGTRIVHVFWPLPDQTS